MCAVYLLLSLYESGLGLSPVVVKWKGLTGVDAGAFGEPGSEL